MPPTDIPLLHFVVALGIGLLIGAERERRKGDGPQRAAAGIRSFTVAALAGAIGQALGGAALLAVVTAGIAVLAALAYWRGPRDDPGLTTEIALILTALLGGLAVTAPETAAMAGVAVAALLAARTPLHRFVRQVLTEAELRDALIFAAATLVVLPLLPDAPTGPLDAINPRRLWLVVILVMAIGAAGHIAGRAFGARLGLPLAGLAGGFVSSTATIGAMGARAAKAPSLLAAASAGAVLSTVSTVLQMAAVLAATSPVALQTLAPALLSAGCAALVYGAALTLPALRRPVAAEAAAQDGRAFHPGAALLFGALLAGILLATAALQHWLGEAGLLAGAALAGLVDTHAPAVSVAALVASGHVAAPAAAIAVLAAFSTNTVSKIVLACLGGGGAGFTLRVIPGLLLVALAAWSGLLLW